MSYFFEDDMGKIFLLLTAVAIAVFVAAVHGDNLDEARFMRECQAYRKHYECEAMWRAGENHTQVMPVFIPMGSGR